MIQALSWSRRPARCAKPYSIDLRERALARFEKGESARSVARALDLGVSTVIRWVSRKRATGSVAPDQMGGHRPHLITGENADYLRGRLSEGDVTIRQLVRELADRKLKVDARTVWSFAHREGFSLKKNRAGQRAKAP